MENNKKNFSRHARVWILLISVVVAIGCYCSRPSKTSYIVVQGSSWEGVNLHGKNSSVQGFIDDLLFEIAEKENIRIEIRKEEERRVLSLLERDNVDAVLSITVPTVQNQRVYQFSEPFFAVGPVLVIRSGDTYNSLASLKDKVVGFQRGFGGDFETQNGLQIIFRPYDQMTYAMEDLLYAKIDAVVLDSIYAYQLLSGLYASKVRIVKPPLKVTQFRLVSKSQQDNDLIELFNKGIKQMKAGDGFRDLLDYWSLFDPTFE